jgi:hypothetical protein
MGGWTGLRCSAFQRIPKTTVAEHRRHRQPCLERRAGEWTLVLFDCCGDNRISYKKREIRSAAPLCREGTSSSNPEAKLLKIFLLKRQLHSLKKPPLCAWALAPVTGFTGVRGRVVTDLRRVVTEGSEVREGGMMHSLFDQIVVGTKPLVLALRRIPA